MFRMSHKEDRSNFDAAFVSNELKVWQKYIAAFPTVAAAIAASIAVMSIVGWISGLGILTSVLPGMPTMKPITASMILALAAALYLCNRPYDPGPRMTAITLIFLVLASSCFFLFMNSESRIMYDVQWQEPAKATGFTLLMLAVMLFMIITSSLRESIITGILIVTCVLPLHRLITFTIGRGALQTSDLFVTMSLPTSLSLFILSCGIALTPMSPIAQQLTNNTLRGRILRKNLPLLIVAPTVVAAIISSAESSGLYGSDVSLIVILSLLNAAMIYMLWGFSNRMQKIDTYRNIAVRTLKNNEAYANQIIEGAPEAMLIVDNDGRIRRINKRIEEIFGYKRKELLGQNLEILVPGRYRSGHKAHRNKFFESPEPRYMGQGRTLFARRKDGSEVAVEVALAPLRSRKGHQVLATIADISERLNNQKKIENALKEKTLLLNEVHHRVKNNLQIIASLLNIQASTVKDSELCKLVAESESRIQSMAMVHQILYEHSDFANIELGAYIHRLSELLRGVHDANGRGITININTENVYMDINVAIPLGIITNELLCNAFKHAFPDNRGGEIWVELIRLSKTTARLTVRDNGRGLAHGSTAPAGTSLGMKIIMLLAQQIRGKLEIAEGDHGCFSLTFKYNETRDAKNDAGKSGETGKIYAEM